MSKTEWPDWANFRATDANGTRYFYEKRPEQYEEYGCWNSDGGAWIDDDNACPNWRDTLEEKPNMAKPRIRIAWKIGGESGHGHWYPASMRPLIENVVVILGEDTHWIEEEGADPYVSIEVPADPYAELKAAAHDPTKQIRCFNGPWCDSGEEWHWDRPPEDYQIRDKPKEPVVKTAYRRRLQFPDGERMWFEADTPNDIKLVDSECGKWLGPVETFTYEEPAE